MYLLDRSLIDNSTLLLSKRNLYKYDIIIIIFIIIIIVIIIILEKGCFFAHYSIGSKAWHHETKKIFLSIAISSDKVLSSL